MIKIQNENDVAARLESALYSAGRPLTLEELSQSIWNRITSKNYSHIGLDY